MLRYAFALLLSMRYERDILSRTTVIMALARNAISHTPYNTSKSISHTIYRSLKAINIHTAFPISHPKSHNIPLKESRADIGFDMKNAV